MCGLIDEGSSRLPARTTRNCGLVATLPKRCEPQLGQNCLVTSSPLSAFFVYSESDPETTRSSVRTNRLTEPFAARCWQSRHQQIRVARGSAASLKLTAPQRQRPVLSVIQSTSMGWVRSREMTNDNHLYPLRYPRRQQSSTGNPRGL